jgi:ABC-type transport system involved in multi-copper enzyme maturation permease subunit
MNVLPVIGRELRASSRQAFTYHLRLLGAGAALAMGLFSGWDITPGSGMGVELFAMMHCVTFCAICLLVPLLTVDCLSRERREGTLGLLMMTQLKPFAVVTAKAMVHGLRACTLWLAVVPVVTLPLLLGGIGWRELLLSSAIDVFAICWGLAVGILASAWSREWPGAMARLAIVAGLSAFMLGMGLRFASDAMASSAWGNSAIGWSSFIPNRNYGGRAVLFGIRNSNLPGFLDDLWFLADPFSSLPPGLIATIPANRFGLALAGIILLSLLTLCLGILLAGAKTSRSWQEQSASALARWFRRRFCQPVFWRSVYRRWQARRLDRNPVGWLEQRAWTGRMILLVWFGGIMLLDSMFMVSSDYLVNLAAVQRTLCWLFAGTIAISACGSFRRERESGILELLLVSPLGEDRIITGRVRGLFLHFMPAAIMLLGLWAYSTTFVRDPYYDSLHDIPVAAAMFVTVPIIGLYFSLSSRHFMTAFLAVLGLGIVLPMILPVISYGLYVLFFQNSSTNGPVGFPILPTLGYQAGLAVVCWRLLGRRLRRRAFPLPKLRN